MATFTLTTKHKREVRTIAIAQRRIERDLIGWAPPSTPILARRQQETIARLIARDGPSCYLCRRTLDRSQYHIEHIIARSQGGTNEDANLAVSCVPCNIRKSDSYISMRITDRIPCYQLAVRHPH